MSDVSYWERKFVECLIEKRIRLKLIAVGILLTATAAGYLLMPGASPQNAEKSVIDTHAPEAKVESITPSVVRRQLVPQPLNAREFDRKTNGRVVVIDRANFRVYEVTSGCPSECTVSMIIDNPYENLSMAELRTLAVQDATAAFQFAARQYAEAEIEVEITEAREYGLRSVALAPSEDAAWFYNGAIEHLGLGITSDPAASERRVIESYIWMQAGHMLGLVESRFRDSARFILEKRKIETTILDDQATALADRLLNLRMQLTGLPFPANGS